MSPTELPPCGLEKGTPPRIADFLETDLRRVHVPRVRQAIHVPLTREVIGCPRQSSIGALPQWRLHRVKLDALIRHRVRSLDRGGPGIVVIKFPSEESPVAA